MGVWVVGWEVGALLAIPSPEWAYLVAVVEISVVTAICRAIESTTRAPGALGGQETRVVLMSALRWRPLLLDLAFVVDVVGIDM
jgi:hypothetical protein